MAMADFFFSGNPGRREEMAYLRAKLNLLIDKCCQGTNMLIGIIETHFKERKFRKITVEKSKDIRYNCEMIIERVEEIRKYLESKSLEVKQWLGTELFEKLISIDTSFQEAIQRAKTWMLGSRYTFTLGAIIVPILIKKTNLIPLLTQSLTNFSGRSIMFSIITVGVGVDIIGSIIIGAMEKSDLENAIQEYKKAIGMLEPGAETFYQNTCMVRARIECLHN